MSKIGQKVEHVPDGSPVRYRQDNLVPLPQCGTNEEQKLPYLQLLGFSIILNAKTKVQDILFICSKKSYNNHLARPSLPSPSQQTQQNFQDGE